MKILLRGLWDHEVIDLAKEGLLKELEIPLPFSPPNLPLDLLTQIMEGWDLSQIQIMVDLIQLPLRRFHLGHVIAMVGALGVETEWRALPNSVLNLFHKNQFDLLRLTNYHQQDLHLSGLHVAQHLGMMCHHLLRSLLLRLLLSHLQQRVSILTGLNW
jgi:hypothetical protein